MFFSAGRAAHVHHFKDIRQGALQSDCVMFLGWCTGWDENVVRGLVEGCERRGARVLLAIITVRQFIRCLSVHLVVFLSVCSF